MPGLMEAIYESLRVLCLAYPDKDVNDEIHARINLIFHEKVISKISRRGLYPHLKSSRVQGKSLSTDSYSPTLSDLAFPSRISRLILTAFAKAESQKETGITGEPLPSPLQIAYDYLSVPNEPVSRAYAFYTIRAYLFDVHKVYPNAKGMERIGKTFNISDVESQLFTIKSHIENREAIDIVEASPVRSILGHLLAITGLVYLRLGTKARKRIADDDVSVARINYCSNKTLSPYSELEFRKYDDVKNLPDLSELINMLWGLPLPIRGAETVFFNGLRFSHDGGTVLSVSGAAGTGKTSFAIGLCASLAPLGTKTFYITAEENPDDLLMRLETLIPSDLSRSTRFWPSNSEEYFIIERVPPSELGIGKGAATLSKIMEDITKKMPPPAEEGIPLSCPLAIVLDGLQFYLNESDLEYPIDEFIRDCRELGALVIITGANDSVVMQKLQYLVDSVITLEYTNTESPDEKPVRLLRLIKSRHQISRPGAHVIHISGGNGLNISPQLPSQLDRRSYFKPSSPHDTHYFDLLNRVVPDDPNELAKIDFLGRDKDPVGNISIANEHQLYIWDRSQILVHGYGSGGKSGLALKLAASPILQLLKKDAAYNNNIVVSPSERPRVLVISLLYDDEYYKKLWRWLNLLFTREYDDIGLPNNYLQERNLEVLHFFPGYVNPEDLFSRIVTILDKATLEGEPFRSVVLDGLHNVFLQFPRLQDTPMLWSMLYMMLRTRGVTIVTTHTTMKVGALEKMGETQASAIKRMAPLFSAIVQAADFYFELNQPPQEDDHVKVDQEGRPDKSRCLDSGYLLTTEAVWGQSMPDSTRKWSREKLVIYGAVSGQLPLTLR